MEIPVPEKKKEPQKYESSYLRELTDDELDDYSLAYPTNIQVKGEVMRRKEEKIKNRKTTIIGK